MFSTSVINYIEPFQGNEAALGLDVTNNSAVMDALRQAEASGRPTATRLFALAQNSKPEPSFGVMMPVYERAAPNGTRGALLGETATILRGRTLVENIMARAGQTGNSAAQHERQHFVGAHVNAHQTSGGFVATNGIKRPTDLGGTQAPQNEKHDHHSQQHVPPLRELWNAVQAQRAARSA